MRSSLFILLYFCACQYLGIETHKDSVTLTRVAQTKYEQHIESINTCLKNGGGKELNDSQHNAMLQQLQQEGETIDQANYGSICANFTTGTIESEQERRCRYKLDIYPTELIKYCIEQARGMTKTIEESIKYACNTAKEEAENLTPEQTEALQLTRLPGFQKLKTDGCDN